MSWLSSCNTGDVTRVVVANSRIRCGKHEAAIPRYTHISSYIRGLKERRRRVTRECYDMYRAILSGTPPEGGRSSYDNKLAELRAIEEKIEEMMAARHNPEYFHERDDIAARVSAASAKERAHVSRNPHDPEVARVVVSSFRDRLSASRELAALSGSPINEFIKSEFADIPIDLPVDAPVGKKKPRAKAKLTDVQKEEIKDNIKDLLKRVYKFKTKEECLSKKRSEPFYTSKEDILKEIDANENLKKLMPSNYKSLSKEKLCEFFHQ